MEKTVKAKASLVLEEMLTIRDRWCRDCEIVQDKKTPARYSEIYDDLSVGNVCGTHLMPEDMRRKWSRIRTLKGIYDYQLKAYVDPSTLQPLPIQPAKSGAKS